MENLQIVWIVCFDEDDQPIHTDEMPECDDPSCPCHTVERQTLNSPLDESAEDEEDL